MRRKLIVPGSDRTHVWVYTLEVSQEGEGILVLKAEKRAKQSSSKRSPVVRHHRKEKAACDVCGEEKPGGSCTSSLNCKGCPTRRMRLKKQLKEQKALLQEGRSSAPVRGAGSS